MQLPRANQAVAAQQAATACVEFLLPSAAWRTKINQMRITPGLHSDPFIGGSAFTRWPLRDHGIFHSRSKASVSDRWSISGYFKPMSEEQWRPIPTKQHKPRIYALQSQKSFQTVDRCSARETHFILDEKCAHFNALYYANALYVFLGFSLFHSRSSVSNWDFLYCISGL